MKEQRIDDINHFSRRLVYLPSHALALLSLQVRSRIRAFFLSASISTLLSLVRNQPCFHLTFSAVENRDPILISFSALTALVFLFSADRVRFNLIFLPFLPSSFEWSADYCRLISFYSRVRSTTLWSFLTPLPDITPVTRRTSTISFPTNMAFPCPLVPWIRWIRVNSCISEPFSSITPGSSFILLAGVRALILLLDHPL